MPFCMNKNSQDVNKSFKAVQNNIQTNVEESTIASNNDSSADSNGSCNVSVDNLDDSSPSCHDLLHQTHLCVTPQIVNLIDYIGPESNEKYSFVFPSYLNDNSQDGINRLVGLLRLSGAQGNFNLISNGYEKKRERIQMVCSCYRKYRNCGLNKRKSQSTLQADSLLHCGFNFTIIWREKKGK